MAGKKKESAISLNKKARHDYFIEKKLEAGIALEGWEVKSLRAAKVQLNGSYILLKAGEIFLFGALITPLPSASTHLPADPQRTRKLLLHRREISMLIGATERKGATIIPTALYWRGGKAKLEIGIARGKKLHDKRQAEKEREWRQEQARIRR